MKQGKEEGSHGEPEDETMMALSKASQSSLFTLSLPPEAFSTSIVLWYQAASAHSLHDQ